MTCTGGSWDQVMAGSGGVPPGAGEEGAKRGGENMEVGGGDPGGVYMMG
jgi:hypothetical protein